MEKNSSTLLLSELRRSIRFALIVAASLSTTACTLRQERFSSPEEAARALVDASKSEQSDVVRRILGRGADEVLSSGDEVADRQARDKFLKAYDEKHELVTEPDGSTTLQVGRDDWPMPIPLVKSFGSWRFDTHRGKEEILNRRIGRNELSVQQVCLAIVDAQREYISQDRNGDGVREYARKVISDPGQRNGLYWETRADEPPSPLGPLVADAVEEGYGGAKTQSGEPRPYHGYYFKLLQSQGPDAPGGARDYVLKGKMTEGFAVVAWPAEYGNSGVMTFLVNHQGVVYERNLGRRTPSIASAMTTFDPDGRWNIE
jgi:hypothetical protein